MIAYWEGTHMIMTTVDALQVGHQGPQVLELRRYMERYGYIVTRSVLDFVGKIPEATREVTAFGEDFNEELEQTVRKFQRTLGLKETGVVEGKTRALINTPRCGLPDVPGHSIGTNYYAACAWDRKDLRFHIAQVLPQLGEAAHRKAFVDGLKKWAEVAGLTFSEGPLGSEIQSFIYDGDGVGNTYAFAYFPCSGGVSGDVNFDRFDAWSVATPTPGDHVDFVSVALHEIGHALGLGHSNVPDSVMWPYFEFGEMRRDPRADDIAGMNVLYGARSSASKSHDQRRER
jgi:hypothetical protein